MQTASLKTTAPAGTGISQQLFPNVQNMTLDRGNKLHLLGSVQSLCIFSSFTREQLQAYKQKDRKCILLLQLDLEHLIAFGDGILL